MIISMIRTQFRLLSSYIPFFKINVSFDLYTHLLILVYSNHTHIGLKVFTEKKEKRKLIQRLAITEKKEENIYVYWYLGECLIYDNL